MTKLKMCILLIAPFIVACSNVDSSKVAPTEIYTAYNSSYDEEAGKIIFNANFTVGGSIGTGVVLEEGSSISVNGDPLRRSSSIFGETSYYLTKYSPSYDQLSQTYYYEYRDNLGKTYRNPIQIPSRFELLSSSVHPGSDLVIAWHAGLGLSVRESLQASLGTREGKQVLFASDNYGGRDGRIVFNRADLMPFSGQDVVIRVCRRYSTGNIDAPQAGGYMDSEYCAARIQAHLP